jgi:hypothetical protein
VKGINSPAKRRMTSGAIDVPSVFLEEGRRDGRNQKEKRMRGWDAIKAGTCFRFKAQLLAYYWRGHH